MTESGEQARDQRDPSVQAGEGGRLEVPQCKDDLDRLPRAPRAADKPSGKVGLFQPIE